MNPSNSPKQDAASLVERLLTARLNRAGIRGRAKEGCFRLEAGELAPDAAGGSVRVRTWRHWSDATVKLESNTGEFMGYSVPRFADPPSTQQASRDEAEAQARALIEVPGDARLKSAYSFEYAQGRTLIALEWEHWYKGLRVEGDFLRVYLHPGANRIVSVERYWRQVKL